MTKRYCRCSKRKCLRYELQAKDIQSSMYGMRSMVYDIRWPEEYTGGGNTDRRFYLSEMQTGKTTDNTTNSTAQNSANVNRRIDTKKIVVQPNHYFFKYYMWYKDTHISIISYIEKIGNSKKQKTLINQGFITCLSN